MRVNVEIEHVVKESDLSTPYFQWALEEGFDVQVGKPFPIELDVEYEIEYSHLGFEAFADVVIHEVVFVETGEKVPAGFLSKKDIETIYESIWESEQHDA